jgi:hypothetical protein
MALAATMVPLAAVAALSTGQRIAQHGFTPDRFWAAVFVAIAAAVAIGYAWALFRGRFAWPAPLRDTNVRLAAGVCLLALFLALPIVNFGALSARDQVARLESGRISPERFDWAALRFDFGLAGRRALRKLAAAGPYKALAGKALQTQDRWALRGPEVASPLTPVLPAKVQVDGGAAVPAGLMETIKDSRRCGGERDSCRLGLLSSEQAVLITGAAEALLFQRGPGGRWSHLGGNVPAALPDPQVLANGTVELRTVTKRQVFVGGQPVGVIFD